MNKQFGFTLIEVVVVVAIALTLTMMSGIGMGGFTNRLDVQQEAIKFRDALWRARNLALVSGQCVTVNIAAQKVTVNTYALTPNCTAPFGVATSTRVTTFPTTVTLTPFNTGNPLVFNRNGGTNYATASIMTLAGATRSFTYSIYPAIGQIRYQ